MVFQPLDTPGCIYWIPTCCLQICALLQSFWTQRLVQNVQFTSPQTWPTWPSLNVREGLMAFLESLRNRRGRHFLVAKRRCRLHSAWTAFLPATKHLVKTSSIQLDHQATVPIQRFKKGWEHRTYHVVAHLFPSASFYF